MELEQRTLWEAVATTADLPLIPQRLDAIRSHAHVKRAIEVALTGGHRLALISVGAAEDAVCLANWSRAQGGEVAVVDACPCGNHTAAALVCHCTERAVRGWWRATPFRAAMTADIVVEVLLPSYAQINASREQEQDEVLLARVAIARARLAQMPQAHTILDEAGQRLMQAATRQLVFTSYRYERVLAVARTIAALAGAERMASGAPSWIWDG